MPGIRDLRINTSGSGGGTIRTTDITGSGSTSSSGSSGSTVVASSTIGGTTSTSIETTTIATGATVEVGGQNLGLLDNASGLYVDTIQVDGGDVLRFKGLLAGTGISFNTTGEYVQISTSVLEQGLLSLFSLAEMGATSVVAKGVLYGRTDGKLDFLDPNAPNDYLTYNGTDLVWAQLPTIPNLSGGSGIDVLKSGASNSISLQPSGVAAGTYVSPSISIDQFGRITSAASVPIGEQNTASNVGAGEGLFKQKVALNLEFKSLVAGNGINLISDADTVTVFIPPSGATAGAYGAPDAIPVLTVDSMGRVSSIATTPIVSSTNTVAGIVRLGTQAEIDVGTSNAVLTAGTLANVASTSPIVLGLRNVLFNATGVVAGTYGDNGTVAAVTVDASGRVSSVANVPIRLATTAQTGLIEIATQAEVNDGTSTTLAVTPSVLANLDPTSAAAIAIRAAILVSNSVSNAMLAKMPARSIKANITNGDADAVDVDVSDVLDLVTPTQGSLTYRNATDWVGLAPGLAGEVLVTAGPAANPYWTNIQNVVPTFIGATSLVAGVKGIVPAPAIGDQAKFLRGDSTWQTLSAIAVSGSASDLVTGTVPTAVLPSFAGGEVVSAVGTNALNLVPTGVTAGTYPKFTVDAKGRVTAGMPLVNTDVPSFTGATALTAGTLGGVPVPAAGDENKVLRGDSTWLTLASVATSGSATDLGTGTLPAARLPAFTGDATVAVGTSTITLVASGVTAGIYPKVTVDAKGRVTAGTTLVNTDVPAFTGATALAAGTLGGVPAPLAGDENKVLRGDSTWLTLATVATSGSATDLGTGTLPAARLPAFTGDATVTAGTSTITLVASGVTAGTYPKVTVDAKGRITAGTTLTNTDLPTFTGATATVAGTLGGVPAPAAGDENKVLRGDATWLTLASIATSGSATDLTTGTIPAARLPASGVTAGTYTKLTVDASGRVTSGTTLINTDVPSFTGANGTTVGTLGGVPAPVATDNTKFLRGDGTWSDYIPRLIDSSNNVQLTVDTDGVTIPNLSVTGVLTVNNATALTVSDRFVILNTGETGPGVSLLNSGIAVDRGATMYGFGWTETNGGFWGPISDNAAPFVPDWSATGVYAIGEYVEESGVTYKAISLPTVGTFVPAEWNAESPPSFDIDAATTLGNIDTIKSSAGGATTIANALVVSGSITGNIAASQVNSGTLDSARLPAMIGATATVAGTLGAVPAPAAGDEIKFLRGDGTWVAETTSASYLTTGTLPAARLPNSGVTAGTYGSTSEIPVIAVDTYGRITSVSTIAPSVVTNSTLTGVGTTASQLSLAASGVTAGTYGTTSAIPILTIDTYGRVTATSTVAPIINVAARLTGNGSSATPVDLASSGVTAGSYGATASIPVLTVDNYGRVTAVSTVTPTVSVETRLTGTGTSASPIDLATSGVTAGSYGSASLTPVITVDAYGRVTTASTVAHTVSVNSRLTGTGTSASPIDLATSGVTAASYGSATAIPVLTVDTYGRITAASTVTPTVSVAARLTGNGASGTPIDLATSGVTAASYGSATAIPVLTVDTYGRVTAASTAAPTVVAAARLTGNGATATPLDLATSGVTAASYGSTSAIPVLTVDTYGRVTAASTVAPTVVVASRLSGNGATATPIDLANSGVSAGSYGSATMIPILTVDTYGRVTAASTIAPTVSVAARLTGDGTSGTPIDLATSGVTAGSFGSTTAIPVLTIDTYGRVTAASTVAALSSVSVTARLTGNGAAATPIDLATSGVTAGAYGSSTAVPVVTVDTYGRVTAVSTARQTNYVTNTSTAPASPLIGDIWHNTSTHRVYMYVNDGSQNLWLQIQ